MNLGVLCSGYLGYEILIKLFEKYEVVYVFTDSSSNNIVEFCKTNDIPHFIGNPRLGKASGFIKDYYSDVLVSVNYLFVIENDVIQMGRKLVFNIHGSLLPKYRGRSPHVWAIINNEKSVGITAHIIDEKCDTGDILEQIEIPIGIHDTGNDILIKYSKNYFPLIERVIGSFMNNTLSFKKQDESKASHFGKRSPDDGHLDWNWQKERIYNWVRAQASPYPGAFTFYHGEKVIIDKIEFTDFGFHDDMKNGEILDINPLLIKTPNGVISIETIRKSFNFIKGEILE